MPKTKARIAEYKYKTKKFECPVIPGSARGGYEPGCPGTIDFKNRPKEDKDRNNNLEKWLDKNTVDSQFSEVKIDGDYEEATTFRYSDGKVICSISIFERTERDNFSSTDPLKYQRIAVIRVQPPSAVPGEIERVLEKYGYSCK